MTRMESTVCNLCHYAQSSPWITTQDRGQGRFQIVRCPLCGLAYVDPRPTQSAIAAYYPDDYYVYGEPPLTWLGRQKARLVETIAAEYDGHAALRDMSRGRTMHQLLAGALRYKLRRLPPYVPAGRLLDIGCATGRDLDLARRGGWETHGVEISTNASEVARQKGHAVFVGRLHEANYPDAFFDAVTIWDVLEHLHNPLETLREIKRVLKPGGHLLGKALNADSVQARLFRSRWWPGMDVPRHLFFYTPAVLRAYLREVGMELAHLAFLSSPRCLSECLDLVWSDAFRRQAGTLPRALKLLDDLVSLPWPFVLDVLGLGDAMFFDAVEITGSCRVTSVGGTSDR